MRAERKETETRLIKEDGVDIELAPENCPILYTQYIFLHLCSIGSPSCGPSITHCACSNDYANMRDVRLRHVSRRKNLFAFGCNIFTKRYKVAVTINHLFSEIAASEHYLHHVRTYGIKTSSII
ncbi:hypothetical protein ACS0PU_006908 [Formica fusca]